MTGSADFRTVLDYHRRTKHRPGAYARSAGFMDWANQPEPFRFYRGGAPIRLPLLDLDPVPATAPAPFTPFSIGGLLELSLALSAWKVAGLSCWALRINPSSGNLHSTEAHLIVSPQVLPGAGLCHYNPLGHMLEPRARIDAALWQATVDDLGGEGLMVGLTSIFWREAWKYGERAWRYCQLDIGHALAALEVAAGFFGWRATVLQSVSDEEAERILGLDRTAWPAGEAEAPELIAWIHPAGRLPTRLDLSPKLVEAFAEVEVFGTPSRLSPSHVDWEVIPAVARAARRPRDSSQKGSRPVSLFPHGIWPSGISPAVVRRRRSGQSYDATLFIPIEVLDRILKATGFGAEVGLALWIHRVEDLESGLYWYERCPGTAGALARASGAGLEWQAAPAVEGLWRLAAGDLQAEAQRLACNQDIAADGVLAVAMVADFQEPVVRAPHRYRELFWSCGRIGQALYLAAEAEGLSGTGIGCFFDDEIHRRLGFVDERYQCLYQFAVGRPIPDRRLRTEPPYRHLQSA